MLKDYLKLIGMSVYKLSKDSGVPYTTVLELSKNKTNVKKISVGTAIAISDYLNLDITHFINICSEERHNFEFFKSQVSHSLKAKGDINFIIDLVEDDEIKHYFEYGWHEESLYLLALLDTLSDENGLKRVDKYDELRNLKLEKPVYPKDVELIDSLNKNDNKKKETLKKALDEFLKYNIVETNFREAM